jgi:signal transduction histidine kinase
MFVFLIYPLLAAAFRWSLYEVMLTALVVDALIVSQALVITDQGLAVGAAVEMNIFIMRVVSVPFLGVMIGHLAESEKQRRREAVDIGTVLRSARFSGEVDQTLALVLGSLVNMFGAATVLLALTDRRTGRVFLWRTDAGDETPLTSSETELPADRQQDYFFDLPGVVCDVVRRRFPFMARSQRVAAFDELGRRMRLPRRFEIPDIFLERHPCGRVVSLSLAFDNAWAGRLFVLDPRRHLSWDHTARLALRIGGDLGPAAYALYRVHHLRTRAQAIARARIARELHDGVTQSLLGVEMLLAVLRRRALHEAPPLNDDLRRIHEIVREEIIALREVIERGRAGEVTSGDALADLEELVDRFQRHSGIQAKFISDGRTVPLTLHIYGEVVRMVHEALVNVRKHSGARRVIVRSNVVNEWWTVSVEDDGRGFQFAGVKTQLQLDERHEGPRSLLERAKRLGAELNVESKPGLGSRIGIAIRIAAA